MSDLIKKYEGLRLQAYKCPAGVWTIGYGITQMPDGKFIQPGDIITKEHADVLLTDYLMRHVFPVFTKIPYKLTQNQKEALMSLIYNWGQSGFLRSKLYKAICNRNWTEVFRQWDFGLKNGLNGLLKRRSEELSLFMKDI